VSGKAKPTPCYLDSFDVWKIVHGRKIWRSADGKRLYTWDSLHGEIEVYTARGRHLGAIDAVDGKLVKTAEKGRKISVK
jgi:hypothetical protein